MPLKVYIQLELPLDFYEVVYYYLIMTKLRKSKEFLGHMTLSAIFLAVFLVPFSSHAQRARTVTTTNAVTTTTNSTVATISKK